jgi:Holliday junction resolvase RusA-like endonuclease
MTVTKLTVSSHLSYQRCVWLATTSPDRALVVEIPALPPGINSQYAVGRGRGDKGKAHVYLTEYANTWSAKAALIIGAKAGLVGWYHRFTSYGLLLIFSGSGLDVDAPVKLVMDTLTRKLGFDDSLIVEQASLRLNSPEKKLVLVLYPCEELVSWDLVPMPNKEKVDEA